MLCINLSTQDPYFNLATEEYLLRSGKEDFFLVSVNYPSVIIGKHQIANAESAAQYVSENGIPVIRRISGGGTVYHDEGNLNFTFICESTSGHQVDFRKHTEPIINFLKSKNVNAEFYGKNQINADGIKISGNAEHIYKNRVLHHGTLLYCSSLEKLHNSIKQSYGKYSSRAVQSNRTVVTNLAGRLAGIKSIEELRTGLLEYIINREPGSRIYNLTEAEIVEVAKLAATKYRSWEWNYGYGPAYVFTNSFQFKRNPFKCTISVKDGLITDCLLEGDGKVKIAEKYLLGKRHMFDELKSLLSSVNPIMDKDFVHNLF